MSVTKKLKFDKEVVEIIGNLEWSNDGLVCEIVNKNGMPMILKRKLYLKLDKALKALGGKWSRATQAHIFETDPREQIEGFFYSGEIEIIVDGFFETPLAVIERMLDLVPVNFGHTILEPSAGNGAIINHLLRYVSSEKITAVEENATRARKITDVFQVSCHAGDFLEWGDSGLLHGVIFDRVYMNPPFEKKQYIDHIRKAYSLLAPEGILISVAPNSAIFSNDIKTVKFRGEVIKANGTMQPLPENSFKVSGTMVNSCLVVMKNGIVYTGINEVLDKTPDFRQKRRNRG